MDFSCFFWTRGCEECSAHLLPCSSGRQDVKLGKLSRVFLGLEAQRGNAGGPAVCRGRGGRGRGGRVRQDGTCVGGVLYWWGGLTEECCSCGSTGQGTHTGEKPEGPQKWSHELRLASSIHEQTLHEDVKHHPKCYTLMTTAVFRLVPNIFN